MFRTARLRPAVGAAKVHSQPPGGEVQPGQKRLDNRFMSWCSVNITAKVPSAFVLACLHKSNQFLVAGLRS
jgi:hypothetical protein